MACKLVKTEYRFEVEHQAYIESARNWSAPTAYRFDTLEMAVECARRIRKEAASPSDLVLVITWKIESWEYPDGYVRIDGPSHEYQEF